MTAHRRQYIYSAVAAIWLPLLLISCQKPADAGESIPVKADYTAEAEAWADSVSAAMTDAELVGQLVMPAMYASTDSANLRLLHHYSDSLHLGNILLLQGDTASAHAISRELRNRSRVVPFVAIDAEWGLGMRLKDSPSYTPFGRLPENLDDERLYDYGYATGREALRSGINVVFAPVLDVKSVKESAISYRSFGSDPERVAELGTAFARGVEDGNVISVAKHFPGLGATTLDSHRAQPTVQRDRHLIDSLDLYPFTSYINLGLSGIMTGHVWMPALDSIRRSACISPVIQTTLLRQEMHFEGIIFTDAFNMRGLGRTDSPTLAAILAGANVVVAPPDTEAAVGELRDALQSGQLPRTLLLERVRRILFHKYRLR